MWWQHHVKHCSKYTSKHSGCFWKEINGEFVDTSSEKVKYDMKDAEYNFATIVKNIKPINPKTFKVNEEKTRYYQKSYWFCSRGRGKKYTKKIKRGKHHF
jgi:hypothetical protein